VRRIVLRRDGRCGNSGLSPTSPRRYTPCMAAPSAPRYPSAPPGKQEIDLFLRAMHTLLRSSGEVQLRALVESYLAMEPSLHVDALEPEPDLACITYATLRLPACIGLVRHVLLGQTEETFRRRGYPDVEQWQAVEAPGRRRKMRFDGQATLAVFIASPSDIDDLVPTLLALEIEWNKLHGRLHSQPDLISLLHSAANGEPMSSEDHERLLAGVGIDAAGWERLQTIWDGRTHERLRLIAAARKHFGVRLLGGSLNDFRRALHVWWRRLEEGAARTDLESRPVYFVSSNTHSLANLLSGFARAHEAELRHFVEQPERRTLAALADNLQEQRAPGIYDNYLYYVQRHFLADPQQRYAQAARTAAERESGITSINAAQALAVDAQVIDLARLRLDRLDRRLRVPDLELLNASDALIINVDYPLGYAAYQLLHTVSYHTTVLQGLYVMGKAATLNGRIGDVMIANVFLDEHSGNTYMVNNAFIAQDIAPFLAFGTALDGQQAVAVRGTYLQNHRYLDDLYAAGYTVVEMEAGPFLDALVENTFLDRYPTGQVVNLFGAPYEVGIIHYASDTPFSRGNNLGARTLSYFGMDSTYASAVAILRRIFSRELARLKRRRDGGPADVLTAAV